MNIEKNTFSFLDDNKSNCISSKGFHYTDNNFSQYSTDSLFNCHSMYSKTPNGCDNNKYESSTSPMNRLISDIDQLMCYSYQNDQNDQILPHNIYHNNYCHSTKPVSGNPNLFYPKKNSNLDTTGCSKFECSSSSEKSRDYSLTDSLMNLRLYNNQDEFQNNSRNSCFISSSDLDDNSSMMMMMMMSDNDFKKLWDSVIMFCSQNDPMLKRNILNSITQIIQKEMMSPKQCQNIVYLASALLGNVSENYYSDPLLAFYNQELMMLLIKENNLICGDSNNSGPLLESSSSSDWARKSSPIFSEKQNFISSLGPPTRSSSGGGSIFGGVSNNGVVSLKDEIALLSLSYRNRLGLTENDIETAAALYRTSATAMAQRKDAAYQWSGKLPMTLLPKNGQFSRKVFLGGVPWDSTQDDLRMAFSRFGPVAVMFPQKELNGVAKTKSHVNSLKGYCYLIFDCEVSVNRLVNSCVKNPINGGDYYKIASTKFKAKDVQVIPWLLQDSQFSKYGSYNRLVPDSKNTIFVGALHGMLTASALAQIIHELFDNVIYAALDTDKYKYPIGSGRVTFSSHKSYMRAVTANFVNIKTQKFTKTIQIDPYLEDSLCNYCFQSPGIYFCRSFECFRYFCSNCWHTWHKRYEAICNHKPLRRTFKPLFDCPLSTS